MLPTLEEPTQSSHEPFPAPPDPRTGRRSGWLAGFVTALALVLAGVGIGWLLFSSPPLETAPASQAPVEVEAAEEPVAAVAETLLPSVVQIETGSGIGSGVIFDQDGLILTAAHVVAGSDSVTVRLSDGSQYEGTVLGNSAESDIAVISVEATGLPAADLALDSDLQVGQLAVAIGSPFGLDSTVTSGVLSALNQTVQRSGADFQSLIQTDAAINPGNSGGALANRNGEVIGINVSIFSTSGGNDGIGFAVPIDLANELARSIVSGEPVSQAVLGVQGANADGAGGALVIEVAPDSGADEAGLQEGDVIVAVDGVRIDGVGDLVAQVRSFQPGDTVSLDILREGEPITIEAALGS